MTDTQAVMEGHLRWIRDHFAGRLVAQNHGGDSALRDGLMMLVDMRFSAPPRALYARIESAPVEDVLRWAVMAFQVGGLVAVCREILQER